MTHTVAAGTMERTSDPATRVARLRPADEKMPDWRTEWGNFYMGNREDGVLAVFGARPAQP